MKTLSFLYLDSYASLANRQHAKYGGHTAEQIPAPNHVPTVLQNAVDAYTVKPERARKLAVKLGRLAYGEYGLTPGRVNTALRETGAIDGVPWHLAAQLESKLCGY